LRIITSTIANNVMGIIISMIQLVASIILIERRKLFNFTKRDLKNMKYQMKIPDCSYANLISLYGD